MKLNKLLILSIIGFVSFSSCKKDDPVTPVIPNEQEVITTLNYTLTNAFDSTDVVTLTFVDLDGDGGTAPTITGGSLNANKTYNGTMELLDETDPADVEDITEEVLKSVLDTSLMEKSLITCLLPRISKRAANQFMKKYPAGTKVQRVQGHGRICQLTLLNMFVELKS